MVNIQVVSQEAGHLNYLNAKYGDFSVDRLEDVDIEIEISKTKLPENSAVGKETGYHIIDGGIFWNCHRKLGLWQVCIKGIESNKLRVSFWGNSISSKYLAMHILEPLINIKLATKGCVMLHGSAIQTEGKTYVFCSKPGIGKTSLAMHLLEKANANFLSDEFVILSRNGEVYNFPMPVAFYDYNFVKMPYLYSQFSLKERLLLKFKKIIRLITNNRIKIPAYLDLNRICSSCDLVTHDQLKKLYVINLTTEKESHVDQMNIDETINEIMQINSFQFRFFYDALNCYLSQNHGGWLDSIYDIQKDILKGSLGQSQFSKLFIPSQFSPSKKDIANLLV